MSESADRPANLSCGNCGALVPISWASVDDEVWRGVGRCRCGRFVDSYQSDRGLPLVFLPFLLGVGRSSGIGAGTPSP